MELPKNVTQIGETDKSCKIYVEDYVVSYMKQMNRFAEDKEIALALYGRRSSEQSISYNFIYGAAKLNFLQREVRHLSQAQNQEIEKLHKKYFPECEFVGYTILNGEMIEGMYLQEASGCRYVKGYACFYEKNDCMLGYMLDNRVEEAKPEEVSQEKYKDVKKRQEERRQQYTSQQESGKEMVRSRTEIERRMRSMRFAAASMFVLLCLVSVVTLQTEGMNGATGSKIKALFSNVAQKDKSGEDVEAMNGDGINTLVAEEQLAEAIRKENEQLPVSGTAVMATEAPTENPVETPTPEPTEVPENMWTPAPTEEPTPVPTEVPTATPVETATPEPATVPTQGTVTYDTYVIKEGDTLLGISLRRYGNGNYVKAICTLNNISDADNIQIGQKILLP